MNKNIIKPNALKATKSLLLQEQKGDFDKDKLIDEIIMGRNPLLTADNIASRLGIPIEVFHQWVKNADPKYRIPTNSLFGELGRAIFNSSLERTEHYKFAKPDVYIGSYPRWTTETLRSWLRANLK